MKKYIPIKSLRTFQRYMDKAVEFQMNSHSNMGTGEYLDTYTTPNGGWVPASDKEARTYAKGNQLAVRAVISEPEGESA